MIMSTTSPHGEPIELLGIDFDGKLLMNAAVHKCASHASWKMKSLLRVRRFYNTQELIMSFWLSVVVLVLGLNAILAVWLTQYFHIPVSLELDLEVLDVDPPDPPALATPAASPSFTSPSS